MPRLAALGVRRISTGSLLFRAALGSALAAAEAVRDGRPIPAVPPYDEIEALASAYTSRPDHSIDDAPAPKSTSRPATRNR